MKTSVIAMVVKWDSGFNWTLKQPGAAPDLAAWLWTAHQLGEHSYLWGCSRHMGFLHGRKIYRKHERKFTTLSNKIHLIIWLLFEQHLLDFWCRNYSKQLLSWKIMTTMGTNLIFKAIAVTLHLHTDWTLVEIARPFLLWLVNKATSWWWRQDIVGWRVNGLWQNQGIA